MINNSHHIFAEQQQHILLVRCQVEVTFLEIIFSWQNMLAGCGTGWWSPLSWVVQCTESCRCSRAGAGTATGTRAWWWTTRRPGVRRMEMRRADWCSKLLPLYRTILKLKYCYFTIQTVQLVGVGKVVSVINDLLTRWKCVYFHWHLYVSGWCRTTQHCSSKPLFGGNLFRISLTFNLFFMFNICHDNQCDERWIKTWIFHWERVLSIYVSF